ARIGNTSGFMWILDAETPGPRSPWISVDDQFVTEGNSSGATAAMTIRLSKAWTAPINITYATSDGTATAASGDYVSSSGTVTFSPGQTWKIVLVPINGDTVTEA